MWDMAGVYDTVSFLAAWAASITPINVKKVAPEHNNQIMSGYTGLGLDSNWYIYIDMQEGTLTAQ